MGWFTVMLIVVALHQRHPPDQLTAFDVWAIVVWAALLACLMQMLMWLIMRNAG